MVDSSASTLLLASEQEGREAASSFGGDKGLSLSSVAAATPSVAAAAPRAERAIKHGGVQHHEHRVRVSPPRSSPGTRQERQQPAAPAKAAAVAQAAVAAVIADYVDKGVLREEQREQHDPHGRPDQVPVRLPPPVPAEPGVEEPAKKDNDPSAVTQNMAVNAVLGPEPPRPSSSTAGPTRTDPPATHVTWQERRHVSNLGAIAGPHQPSGVGRLKPRADPSGSPVVEGSHTRRGAVRSTKTSGGAPGASLARGGRLNPGFRAAGFSRENQQSGQIVQHDFPVQPTPPGGLSAMTGEPRGGPSTSTADQPGLRTTVFLDGDGTASGRTVTSSAVQPGLHGHTQRETELARLQALHLQSVRDAARLRRQIDLLGSGAKTATSRHEPEHDDIDSAAGGDAMDLHCHEALPVGNPVHDEPRSTRRGRGPPDGQHEPAAQRRRLDASAVWHEYLDPAYVPSHGATVYNDHRVMAMLDLV